eukprot:CAMPEP_0179092040 /NCGR_PEP_ID=MMETSP0796-20121207/42075_1 /TAXON_ID=73915 /ORGANISM="Pyrodinium bahamense, Strain pbaha01" /LENGTH=120 /DNA_ID=CAMNT_0020789639 /DNA_START=78 /DNA_END=442 /DNA_ORIENTATION=+
MTKVVYAAPGKPAEIAAKQVMNVGVFTLLGLVWIQTRREPATKAGEQAIFVVEKAKPAKAVMEAFPVAALKMNVIIPVDAQPSSSGTCRRMAWTSAKTARATEEGVRARPVGEAEGDRGL